jgi:hypothetical protein
MSSLQAFGHPLDEDFANFCNLIYQYLPGKFGSWEKWVEFREMLESPPGWPVAENKTQFELARHWSKNDESSQDAGGSSICADARFVS